MARVRKVKVATVRLWGEDAGAVAWDPRVYAFPALAQETFRGLPGLVADALPDRFGNALIDLWLRQQGRDIASMSPVERLCYMGTRAHALGRRASPPGNSGHNLVLLLDSVQIAVREPVSGVVLGRAAGCCGCG